MLLAFFQPNYSSFLKRSPTCTVSWLVAYLYEIFTLT